MRFILVIFCILFSISIWNPLNAGFIKSEIKEEGQKHTITISFRNEYSLPMWNKFINDPFNFEDDEGNNAFRTIQLNQIANTVKDITSTSYENRKVNRLTFCFIDFGYKTQINYLHDSIKSINEFERFNNSDRFIEIKIEADNLMRLRSPHETRTLKNVRIFNDKYQEWLKDEKRKADYYNLTTQEFNRKYFNNDTSLLTSYDFALIEALKEEENSDSD